MGGWWLEKQPKKTKHDVPEEALSISNGAEVAVEKLFNRSLARQRLLSELSHDGHHGQTAVLQFLKLELGEVLGVVGDESGAEAHVTGGTVGGVLLANGQLNGTQGQKDLPKGHGALGKDLGKGGQGAGVGEHFVCSVWWYGCVGLSEGWWMACGGLDVPGRW